VPSMSHVASEVMLVGGVHALCQILLALSSHQQNGCKQQRSS
jgi:hypothetical protein